MKKSDLSVVAILYLFVFFFTYQTHQLPEEAQSYPGFLLAVIFILNTIYLAVALWRWKVQKLFKDDLEHLYDGFIPSQFFTVMVGAALYMAVALALLKVKAKWIAVVIISLLVVIWLVFTLFLKVPLPVGQLFF